MGVRVEGSGAGICTAVLLAVCGCTSATRDGMATGEGGLAPLPPSAPAASAVVDASGNEAAGAAASAPTASLAAPPPRVLVENIGMHIGGGPNDAVTKEPIAKSVAPCFDSFRACWDAAAGATARGTFGVDLLIPAEGGKAAVSHPRTRIGGDAFRDCVVHVFEEVNFARPRGGRTTVSYSLRFQPIQGDAGFVP